MVFWFSLGFLDDFPFLVLVIYDGDLSRVCSSRLLDLFCIIFGNETVNLQQEDGN